MDWFWIPKRGFDDRPHLNIVDYPDVVPPRRRAAAPTRRRRAASALGPLVGRGHHLLREVQEELLDAAVLLGRRVEVARAHCPSVPESGRGADLSN